MGLTPCEERYRTWASTDKERYKTPPKAKAVSGQETQPNKRAKKHRSSNEAASDQEAQPKEKSNGAPSKANVVTNAERQSGVGATYFTEFNLDENTNDTVKALPKVTAKSGPETP
jgi:hypothetical protein